MDFQVIDVQRKPTITANTSYDFSFSDSQPASPFDPTFITSRGLGASASLNWNLFNGGRRKIQE